MKYYIEITLLRSKIKEHILQTELYSRLHSAFKAVQNEESLICPVGIGFPRYDYNKSRKNNYLGNKWRLFAQSKEQLIGLDLQQRCRELLDSIEISEIKEIPIEKIEGYMNYSRQKVISNPAVKARRYAKRHNVSFDEALEKFKGKGVVSNRPFIQLVSTSNGHNFKIFIEENMADETNNAEFNSFGLHSISTVPIF